MDRNQRTPGCRRSQEDGGVWWAPVPGPDTVFSHTFTATCISQSLPSPPTLSGLASIYPWTGVVRDILGSMILKFPQEPAVCFTFPWSRCRLKKEDWLKKKDRKQRRPGCRREKTRKSRRAPVQGPALPSGEVLSLVPRDCRLFFTRSNKKTGWRRRWKVPGKPCPH